MPTPRSVEPIDEIDASLDPFRVQEVRELGEEDASVKGAGVVVALFERVQPLAEAVVAQVVSAWQPLSDFRFVVSYSIAQMVVWVEADGAIALVFRKVWNVDVWAGHNEG